ncbi:VCBS repeat-containing protein [Candidatus Woesearchaeota archaeon]|nr:VCBS repeat-containing protein [Candidatus Woesearchaeota archaeon]
MRWHILIIALLLVPFVSAAIKTDASILSINDNEAKFVMLSYQDAVYTPRILQLSKFYDWKDLTLADIDGDDYNELIALRDIGSDIYIYDFIDDQLVQKTDAKNIGPFAKDLEWVKIIPVNFDKDKDDELLLLNNRYGRFYLIDRNGAEFTSTLIGDSNNVLYKDWISIESNDIDQDGYPELILLRRNIQPIYIIEYSNGQLTDWKDAKKLGDNIGNVNVKAFAVGDLNNDGKSEVIVGDSDGKIYSVTYSNVVTILAQTQYKNMLDMDIADVNKDGKNELVLIKAERTPVSVYKMIGDSLTEKVINNLEGEVGWVGVAAGKFVSEGSEPVQEIEVEEPKPAVTETITEENLSASEAKPVNEEKVEEKKSYTIYFFLIILLISALIVLFLFLKSKFKNSDDEEEPEEDEDEKKSMWPVSKNSKDLRDMKDFIKKTKR